MAYSSVFAERLVLRRFVGPEVDAYVTEGRGTGLLGCSAEHILSPGDLETLEASHRDHRLKLCLQQSPGNSAGPEVYILLRLLGNGLLYQDVSYL